MNKVVTKLKEGKKTDQALYLVGYFVLIIGFLTLHDFGLWEANKSNWQPVVILGFVIVIITLLLSIFRKKINIDILINQENTIIVVPVKRVMFSGWEKLPEIEIEKKVIESVNLNLFQFSGSEAYIVHLHLSKGKIIELQIKELDVAEAIIAFSKRHLSDSQITINGR